MLLNDYINLEALDYFQN